jgi:repressor LexA
MPLGTPSDALSRSEPGSLTDLERDILDYMVQYLRANTYQPSVREIGERFGIRSTKTVSEHLASLAEKGYLERDPARSRGVRILGVDLNPHTVAIPVYPEIPQGKTGFETDGIEAWLSMDRRLGAARGAYFLRVRGRREAGLDLVEGDLLLVEPDSGHGLKDGDLAVVRAEGAVRLIRVRASPTGLVLRTSSGAEMPFSAAEVQGRVAAIHRRLDGATLPLSPIAH